ncbi:uncharacterized protein CANTADRAFT_3729 [Suhomyces tanzawaensis NRRL Y-17324]|uniref:ATPase expression protein 1 n=1 Tax=Suhomyces tanzawaensis NRRL Y-17324 TaxID=984487 RepID=A0A1E4SQ49_9ASCO|nr:uncharacterized protein CANTADRAFT_3729 [Suhomyces tanzawaensis NRRL Y-17324]ODV81643.1 hypothetical protein CANTADRAFT_3729 [Suhomyces tanzawaensis NRRL Y-17324]
MIRFNIPSRIRHWPKPSLRHLNTKALPRKVKLSHQPIPVIDDTKAELDTHSFERLSQAYQMLGSKNKFSWSALKCYEFYEKSPSTFLQDLMQYPRINKGMISFLFHHYHHSSSIRVLILNDICTLLLAGKLHIVVAVLQEMQKLDILSAPIVTDLDFIISQKTKLDAIKLQITLSDILVRLSTTSGEPMVSSSYLLQFSQHGITISAETVRQVITSLMIDKDVYHSYNVYTILKLLDEYGTTIIDSSLAPKLLEYFIENPKSIFFANELLGRLERSAVLEKESQEAQKMLLNYILVNLECGLSETALSIWFDHIIVTEVCLPALRVFFEKLTDSETMLRVINSIPLHLREANQDILQILVEFYGTRPGFQSEFNKLIPKLATPLPRLVYSSLFKAFMHQNNEGAAERILGIIFKSKNGLSHHEFYYIIDKLLQQEDNMDQCLTMVRNTDISVSKLAYTRIFNEILRTDNIEDYGPFFNELYIKFLKLSADDVALESLTVSIVDYLTTFISTRAGKKMYLRINSLDGKSNAFQSDKYSKMFNFEKYGIPNKFKRFMVLSTGGRRKCLDIIARQSIKESDIDTIKWSIEEMRFLGASVQEISKMISKEVNEQ